MIKIIFSFIITISAMSLSGQEAVFDAVISNDTVLAGNVFIVRYDIVNMEGDFQPPDFSDFNIVSGPAVSSVFSMVNGVSKREISYTYYLRAEDEGDFEIPPALIFISGDTLQTKPLHITVLSNPEGEIVEPGSLPLRNELDFYAPEKGLQYENKKTKPAKRKKKKLKTIRL